MSAVSKELLHSLPKPLADEEVDEKNYCKIRKEVEKWLDPYLSYQHAIRMAEDVWMPKLTAKYGGGSTEHREVPFYREMKSLLEESNIDEGNLGQLMSQVFHIVQKHKPEMITTESPTESAALHRLDPEKQRLLDEKKHHVRLVDIALSCLDDLQLQIITDMYLVSKRLKTLEVALKLDRSPRLITIQKKAAILRIAKTLNII